DAPASIGMRISAVSTNLSQPEARSVQPDARSVRPERRSVRSGVQRGAPDDDQEELGYHPHMTKSHYAAIMPVTVLALSALTFAQTGQRPMSPDGSAQVQVLGKWVKGDRPAFSLGRENYTGGKWIEVTYGRPL